METVSERIKSIRQEIGMNRREFADHFQIPIRTLEDWEYEKRTPPEYVVRLLKYRVLFERKNAIEFVPQNMNGEEADYIREKKGRDILIKLNEDGKQIVVIPHILFTGKRSISWSEVENYLMQYVGEIIEVAETSDCIFIGNDFPDEFSGSEYSRKLKGALPKVKANMSQGIPEMIQIATGKRWNQDYNEKHGNRAKNGWYRYNTRFALPVMNENGEIIEYNIYQAVLIVRFASDGKLYLYDVQNIKKETRYPS